MQSPWLCSVAGVLPPPYFLYGDGGVEANLRACRSVPCEWGSIVRDALFFIGSRRVTRLTLREFVVGWCDQHRVKDAIDHVSSDLGEEFYIPLSTAYWWLRLIREWCRFHFAWLGLDPNRLECLSELRFIEPATVLKVFDPDFPRINKPP